MQLQLANILFVNTVLQLHYCSVFNTVAYAQYHLSFLWKPFLIPLSKNWSHLLIPNQLPSASAHSFHSRWFILFTGHRSYPTSSCHLNRIILPKISQLPGRMPTPSLKYYMQEVTKPYTIKLPPFASIQCPLIHQSLYLPNPREK